MGIATPFCDTKSVVRALGSTSDQPHAVLVISSGAKMCLRV
jgi:hypothetical protein